MVKDSMLPLQEARVRALVGELRSCMLWVQPEKKEEKKRKIKTSYITIFIYNSNYVSESRLILLAA